MSIIHSRISQPRFNRLISLGYLTSTVAREASRSSFPACVSALLSDAMVWEASEHEAPLVFLLAVAG